MQFEFVNNTTKGTQIARILVRSLEQQASQGLTQYSVAYKNRYIVKEGIQRPLRTPLCVEEIANRRLSSHKDY
jgi:hypothetical protein